MSIDEWKAQVLAYAPTLAELYDQLRAMPTALDLVRRDAESMRVFADGAPTFMFDQWRDWRKACLIERRQIPPAEFKQKYPHQAPIGDKEAGQ